MMAPPTAAPGSAAARTDYVSRLQSVPGGRVLPASLLAAAGQLAAGAAFTSPETQASMIVQRQGAVSFTLHEEGDDRAGDLFATDGGAGAGGPRDEELVPATSCGRLRTAGSRPAFTSTSLTRTTCA